VLPGSYRAAGAAGSCRVLRGGSFNNNARNARSVYRNTNNPNNRNRNNGVRVGVMAAYFSPGAKRLAGNIAWLRLDNRGIERKRGLSLAEVAGLRIRRLGRI
jgi:hypothetical protein